MNPASSQRSRWRVGGAVMAAFVVGLGLGRWTAPGSLPPEVPTDEPATAAPEQERRPMVRDRRAGQVAPVQPTLPRGRQDGRPEDLEALTARLRDELRREADAEREDMHRQRHEAFLDTRLERLAEFAEEHNLDDETWTAMEDAVMALHERMGELGPPMGPPGSSTPDAEDARREAFETFSTTLDDLLGTEELRDAFRETMRPPRGPRWGR